MSVLVARRRPEGHETEELDPQVMHELLRYPGQWAAVQGLRVLAVDPDPSVALRIARKKHVTEPLLFRILDSSVCLY